jgi:hypothetical protein
VRTLLLHLNFEKVTVTKKGRSASGRFFLAGGNKLKVKSEKLKVGEESGAS